MAAKMGSGSRLAGELQPVRAPGESIRRQLGEARASHRDCEEAVYVVLQLVGRTWDAGQGGGTRT